MKTKGRKQSPRVEDRRPERMNPFLQAERQQNEAYDTVQPYPDDWMEDNAGGVVGWQYQQAIRAKAEKFKQIRAQQALGLNPAGMDETISTGLRHSIMERMAGRKQAREYTNDETASPFPTQGPSRNPFAQ